MRKKIHIFLFILAVFFFITFFISRRTGIADIDGPLLILGFMSLAIAMRGLKQVKGFAYTFWIFTAVTASMYFPEYFTSIGNFKLTRTITPLLQIIMFGMGSQLALSDFARVIRMPKGVITGLLCQFSIMPLVGFALAVLFRFPPEIAAGIVLVGSSPSGLASNVMSFLARANLALSVTLTACATIMSPLMTPLLMKLFAGQMVEVNFWGMMINIFDVVILPVIAGLIFNIFSREKVSGTNTLKQIIAYGFIILFKNLLTLLTSEITGQQLAVVFMKDILWFGILPVPAAMFFRYFAKGDREMLGNLLSFISMLGIAIIITVITAAGRDSLLDIGLLLVLACLLHNLFGYGIGYTLAKLVFRLPEPDCRTVALEVGMQNGGLASALALQMGKIATVGLAPAVFGPLMNITGSSLAVWWRNRNARNVKE